MNKTVICIETFIESPGSINNFDIRKNRKYDVLREINNPPAYEIVTDSYHCCFVPRILFKDIK